MTLKGKRNMAAQGPRHTAAAPRTYKERATLIPDDYRYHNAVADPQNGTAGITWDVDELWELIPEDKAVVLMVSYGHLADHAERFGSSLATREGDRIVLISTGGDIGRGNVLVAYPKGQGRTVRLLTKFEVTTD